METAFLKQSAERAITAKSLENALQFEPLASDVLVVGYFKTGTTWVQQIVHQLRTGGDMEFRDILDVFPLIDTALDLGQDLNDEQKCFPRCFKVSSWCAPKQNGKYILCLREPRSVAYSWFKYLEGWFFQAGTVSLVNFVKEYWFQGVFGHNFFEYIARWWQHRHNPNLHTVFYEDLVRDHKGGVKAIADFMGIQEESSISTCIELSTFGYMKAHSSKFSSASIRQIRNEAIGVENDSYLSVSKIRKGSTSEGMEMLYELQDEFDKRWKKYVLPVTGSVDYDDLRKKWSN